LNRNANEKSTGSEIGLWKEAIRVNNMAMKHTRPGVAKKKIRPSWERDSWKSLGRAG
jgi:hypothetical protein